MNTGVYSLLDLQFRLQDESGMSDLFSAGVKCAKCLTDI